MYALSEYDYDLPKELIAQHPLEKRDESRLLALKTENGSMSIANFANLNAYLPPQSLIIANNSKVVPVRLFGWRKNQARVEMVLLTPLRILEIKTVKKCDCHDVCAEVLLRPSKRLQSGEILEFPGGLSATIISKRSFGQCEVVLQWCEKSLSAILSKHGEVPLPPYIRREPNLMDVQRYQTVYAKDHGRGSAAAPTAGLHFTQELKTKLLDAGHQWQEVTLFVGYGTFSPIRCRDIREHVIHAEHVDVSAETADSIARAMRDGRPIVAVGTTSLRCVEGVIQKFGRMIAYEGTLDTYIYPGFNFQAVRGLITNFHLPESSLYVLVCAMAGRDRILAAYQRAIAERMRFFSYGDAMFIDNCQHSQIPPASMQVGQS